jgi:hypothetical protein
VTDQTKVLVGVTLGALAGAVVTAVCLTAQGRGGVTRLNDSLDDLAGALARFRDTIRKASAAIDQGRALAEDVRIAVAEQRDAVRPQRTHER